MNCCTLIITRWIICGGLFVYSTSFLFSLINCCSSSRSSLVALLRMKLRAALRPDKYDRCSRLSLFHFVDAFFCALLSASLFTYLNNIVSAFNVNDKIKQVQIIVCFFLLSMTINSKRDIVYLNKRLVRLPCRCLFEKECQDCYNQAAKLMITCKSSWRSFFNWRCFSLRFHLISFLNLL